MKGGCTPCHDASSRARWCARCHAARPRIDTGGCGRFRSPGTRSPLELRPCARSGVVGVGADRPGAARSAQPRKTRAERHGAAAPPLSSQAARITSLPNRLLTGARSARGAAGIGRAARARVLPRKRRGRSDPMATTPCAPRERGSTLAAAAVSARRERDLRLLPCRGAHRQPSSQADAVLWYACGPLRT